MKQKCTHRDFVFWWHLFDFFDKQKVCVCVLCVNTLKREGAARVEMNTDSYCFTSKQHATAMEEMKFNAMIEFHRKCIFTPEKNVWHAKWLIYLKENKNCVHEAEPRVLQRRLVHKMGRRKACARRWRWHCNRNRWPSEFNVKNHKYSSKSLRKWKAISTFTQMVKPFIDDAVQYSRLYHIIIP